jgi:predicted ATPase/DNA-binding SARP family transcriptional activator
VPIAPPPRPLTRFIGRDHEVASVCALLAEHRLVTLTGAGGSGKTRLAAEVAPLAASTLGSEVAWVELAPLEAPHLLAAAVLKAIDVEQGSRPATEALTDALRDRRLLLVLDNCEHLVDACAALADHLLQAASALRILATSREALGVLGERAWLVPGLALPAADERERGDAVSLDQVAQSEAVRLFVDRAQSALAAFRLTHANAAAVARVCRRLDGLPLALELAAARVRALPPEQLAGRLEASLGILATGARTAVPRHRTLRQTIQWSYDLLDEPARTLLRRLAVFAGDFTLDAAERVAAGSGLDTNDILDVLGALVDKSLANMREEDGAARYYLLETIRQFAREQLDAGSEAPAVRARHAATYLALVAEAEPHFITRHRPAWVARVIRELDNVRLALAWTREHDPARHVQLAGMLGWCWYSSGLWSEGRRWLEGALDIPDDAAADADRVRALLGLGVLASLQADVPAAMPRLRTCARMAQAIGDRSREAYAMAYIGVAAGQSGDETAEAPTAAAMAYFREVNDLYGLRLTLIVRSTIHLLRGDASRALAEAEEGVAIARDFGLDRELAIALQVLAAVVLASGDLHRARATFAESLAALQRDPSTFWTARALQLIGVVNCRLGDVREGALLLGAAEATRESVGAGLLEHDRLRLEPVLHAARAAAGAERFEAEWQRGRTLGVDQAVTLALTHVAAAPLPPSEPLRAEQRAGDTPLLEVLALGGLEIRVGGVTLPADAQRQARPRELLLYLLSHPAGRTREQIGLTFWPESSAMQVKNSFHVALHHMRKTLGHAHLITFDGDRYRMAWEAGIRFDARTFEEEVTAALAALAPRRGVRAPERDDEALRSLERALALYRGDFLADAGAGDWHLELRDRLRRLCTDALLIVGERHLLAGAADEATACFRRLVAADEFHEDGHRRLMTAMARAGDRVGALRHYERFEAALRKELEATPEAETRALYERLRRAEPV